jgi:hypothetical protein
MSKKTDPSAVITALLQLLSAIIALWTAAISLESGLARPQDVRPRWAYTAALAAGQLLVYHTGMAAGKVEDRAF